MKDLACKKVGHIVNRKFIKDDILSVFEQDIDKFDVILSTYVVHHLTEEEKHQFFNEVHRCLKAGASAVLGDLMLETFAARELKIAQYRGTGDRGTADAIEERVLLVYRQSEKRTRATRFLYNDKAILGPVLWNPGAKRGH